MGAGTPVEHIDVLDILAHIAALDMKIFEIRHRHDYDIGIHFHHQGDKLFF